MKRNLFFALVFLLIGIGLTWIQGEALSIRAAIKAAYFKPTDDAFKEIYGQGASYGAEASLKVGKFFGLWIAAEQFSKKGEMTFTQEETTIKILPISCGLSLEFNLGFLSPYARLGLGYFHYEESNILGTVKKNDLGYLGQVGLLLKTIGPLYLDFFGHFSSCEVKPLELKAELGGLKAGIGLGLQF